MMNYFYEGKVFQCIFILTTVLFLSSCTMFIQLPDTMVDVHAAYPDSASMIPPAEKTDAFERATMPAPYSAVYRAAQKAALDEKLRLISTDKEKGIILASKSESERPFRSDNNSRGERRYFIAIRMQEKGRKRTEVTIMTKVQGACRYDNPTGVGAWGSAGLLVAELREHEEACKAYSKVHWATSFDHNKGQQNRIMSSVRSQLFAAGYE